MFQGHSNTQPDKTLFFLIFTYLRDRSYWNSRDYASNVSQFNSNNPRINLWNFRDKISRIGNFENGHFEKLTILKNWPFWIFFLQKKFFFCFIFMKISQNSYGRLDGSKFWCFPWFSANFLVCVIKRYTVYDMT